MPELPIDVIRVPQSGSDPGGEANKGKLYTKNVSGITQPHYQASDSTVTQLSNATPTNGSIPYSSLTNKLSVNRKTFLFQTATQGIFDASTDTITVLSNTVYLIRGSLFINLDVNANTTIRSVFEGTATYTSFDGTILVKLMDTFSLGLGASFRLTRITTATQTTITAAFGTTGDRNYFLYYNLVAVVNVGGTMTPSFWFANLANTPIIPAAGTYVGHGQMEIIPLGAAPYTDQNWT